MSKKCFVGTGCRKQVEAGKLTPTSILLTDWSVCLKHDESAVEGRGTAQHRGGPVTAALGLVWVPLATASSSGLLFRVWRFCSPVFLRRTILEHLISFEEKVHVLRKRPKKH